MLVIGDLKLLVRVNVGPTAGAVARENYGSFYDLSAMARDPRRPNFAG
jgi:hypothetical protein